LKGKHFLVLGDWAAAAASQESVVKSLLQG
jgi:hypothetical protein